jgi:hypothetical protein
VKTAEEIMEILEAFDLTGSYRAAGELVSCSHHTVEHWVTRREQGLLVPHRHQILLQRLSRPAEHRRHRPPPRRAAPQRLAVPNLTHPKTDPAAAPPDSR